jgi:hypothetical protein
MPDQPAFTAEAQRDPLRGTEKSEIRLLLKFQVPSFKLKTCL